MASSELKKYVIESGLYNRYAKARHNTWLENQGEKYEGENLNAFECFLGNFDSANWYDIACECQRIGNTSKQRIKRLKVRMKALLSKGDCLFLTMTFNDNVLENTDIKQRRKLVLDFLESLSCDYIGNIDYGKANEREHYHAVVCANHIEYSGWHKNGAIKGLKVRNNAKSGNHIARYIDKLSLHALKDTTYRNRMLYRITG